jgi:hypothetical protein
MAAEAHARSAGGVWYSAFPSRWRSRFGLSVWLIFAISPAFWPAGNGRASTPTNAKATGEPLGRVIDWVLAHGTVKTVSAPVAEALDFGTAEIKVKQQGYQSDDKLARMVAVPVDGSGNVIFCHLTMEGSGVCWRTDKTGVLQATARLGTSGQAMRVSATLSEREDFETQKTYFIQKFAR